MTKPQLFATVYAVVRVPSDERSYYATRETACAIARRSAKHERGTVSVVRCAVPNSAPRDLAVALLNHDHWAGEEVEIARYGEG